MKTESKVPKLVSNILEDSNFKDTELKFTYVRMAELYLADFRENLSKTSIELNAEYSEYTVDEWNDWLLYPVIKKYITHFRNEMMEIVANNQIFSGEYTQSSMKLKQQLELANGGANARLIIVRVPDKEVLDERS